MAKIVIECTEKIVSPDAQVMTVGLNEDGQNTTETSNTSNVLETGNNVEFVVKENDGSTKTIGGRILEINGSKPSSDEDPSTFSFVVDASEEYNSNIMTIESNNIESLTKEGCETVNAEQLKSYVYTEDHNIISYDDNDNPSYIGVGDMVNVTFCEDVTRLGRVIDIDNTIVQIDASSKSQSDIMTFATSHIIDGLILIEKAE